MTTSEIGQRHNLNFANLAKERFVFLYDFGYEEIESSSTIVRFRKDDIEVSIFHGRQSYELGLSISRRGDQYSMSELIRATDLNAAELYHNPVATTEASLATGLVLVAELAKRYGEKALHGDPEFYVALKSQRKSWAERYELEVLAGQLRPKAEEAFRLGNYREAAELYTRIRSCLSPAEIKKLAVADRQRRG